MDLSNLELPGVFERWEDGSIRLAGHRITLVHVLGVLDSGGDLDELVLRFPTVPKDVLKQAWEFCIQNREALCPFYREKKSSAEALGARLRSPGQSREELLTRLHEMNGRHDPD